MDEQRRDVDLDREFAEKILEGRKADQQKQRELFTSYASWGESVSGARILAHLRRETASISYRPGRDGMETAFHEGRRSIVLDILANIEEGRHLSVAGDPDRSDLQQQADMEDLFNA